MGKPDWQSAQVVYSVLSKAYFMCCKVNQEASNKREVCGSARKITYFTREKGVVYSIPLSCGRCYIGQTGHCIIESTKEHAASLNNLSAGGHLPAHCWGCQCTARLHTTNIVGKKLGQACVQIIGDTQNWWKGRWLYYCPIRCAAQKKKKKSCGTFLGNKEAAAPHFRILKPESSGNRVEEEKDP